MKTSLKLRPEAPLSSGGRADPQLFGRLGLDIGRGGGGGEGEMELRGFVVDCEDLLKNGKRLRVAGAVEVVGEIEPEEEVEE